MRFSHLIVWPGLMAVAACGGGSSPMTQDQTLAGATTAVTITASVLDAAAFTATQATGTIDGGTATGDFAGLTGAINATRTEIVLEGGGLVSLEPAGDGFATRFRSSPQGGPSTTGILGVAADALQEGGGAIYTGDTTINAVVGTDVYDLTGDATVDVNFSIGSVTTTLDGLAGSILSPVSGETAISDAGSVTFTGSGLDGSTFSGGTVTTTGAPLALTDAATSTLAGGLFGPQGRAAGGTFVVQDADTTILGDFLAD